MTRLRSLSSISICVLGFMSTGLVVSCSGGHKGGRAEPEQDIAQSGSLSLALTARGESGALYRLRDAFFQVNDPNFNFFTQLSTENDPTASTLETTMPVGDFAITLFQGFALERVDPDGRTSRVTSTLISPSTQNFHINPNEQTNVSYRFETNGEIVDFGQGRLVVDISVTERAGQSRRTVMETNQAALANVTLRGTLDAALSNAGISSVGAVDVYHALIDSYNQAPGRDSSLRHCDDETLAASGGAADAGAGGTGGSAGSGGRGGAAGAAGGIGFPGPIDVPPPIGFPGPIGIPGTGGSTGDSTGTPSLNGFPLACPRLEGQLFDNLDNWFPLAFVNRLDLAPTDGSNCGQQRMIFANNDGGRMFIIVEAQIPNPSPECGVSACLPLAEFWDSQATVDDPAERGRRLADAFLSTGTGAIGPFMNARHLGPQGGQIRTNNFNDFQWTLREFQMQAEPQVVPVPVSVGEAPNGELWDDSSGQPRGEECRQSFLESIPNLLSDNLATLGFPVAAPCEDAESPNDGFRQDYATHLSFGSGTFQSEIDAAVAGTGLSATDIANRARFAGSCMGCHIESSGAFLGRVSAPFSNDFVHVSEQQTESCDGGGTCFGISEALRTVFLPHRINVQRNFIDAGFSCAIPTEPGQDGGVPVPAFDAGVVASLSARGPARTLGGQPVVEHPH